MKKMQKGSAMLWAVLVMLMVSILSGAIVFVDHIYYVQEQNENYTVQAQLYAESAIDLIQADIVRQGEDLTPTDTTDDNYYESPYVSDGNATETVEVSFPDVSNWECMVTISHSAVDTSVDSAGNLTKAKTSGIIYLTAKVTRSTTDGDVLELAEVCAKMHYDGSWIFDGYYGL